MTGRRVPLPAAAGIAIVLALLAWVWWAGSGQSDPDTALASLPAAPVPSASASASDDAPPLLAGGPLPAAAAGPVAFAEVDGLLIGLPHPDPILVAFHEAALPEALALAPRGRLIANDNDAKFVAGEDVAGPGYRVLTSRGRPRPATSAVDIVVPAGSAIFAPVSGEVVEVSEYALYGKLWDWRVVIAPAGRPELAVVLIHLEAPAVAVGDEVEAGVTPIATVRALPFRSHVDDYTPDREPHTHLEVKPAVRAEPLDPNARAVDPDEDLDSDL